MYVCICIKYAGAWERAGDSTRVDATWDAARRDEGPTQGAHTGDPHRGEGPTEDPPPEGRATQGAHTEDTQTLNIIYSPWTLTRGPPLLPMLIAASVWMKPVVSRAAREPRMPYKSNQSKKRGSSDPGLEFRHSRNPDQNYQTRSSVAGVLTGVASFDGDLLFSIFGPGLL